MLPRIMGQHSGSENSFEVRLTSSGLDNGIDGPGITWGVYAIDSMDALACANAHCPRLREEARGEWHFPANVSVIILSVPNVLWLPNDEW